MATGSAGCREFARHATVVLVLVNESQEAK
jgi:hypothetical protein